LRRDRTAPDLRHATSAPHVAIPPSGGAPRTRALEPAWQRFVDRCTIACRASMTISRQTFHCLSLCARPIRGADHAVELAAALETPTSWNELLDQAEQHGLEPLLIAHLRAARIAIPQSAQD